MTRSSLRLPGSGAALALLAAVGLAAIPALASDDGVRSSSSTSYTFVDDGVKTEIEKKDGKLVRVRHDGKKIPLDRVEETDEGTIRIKDDKGNVIVEREIEITPVPPIPSLPPTAPTPPAQRFYTLDRNEARGGRMQGAPPALREFAVQGRAVETPKVMLGVQMAEPDASLRGHLGLKEGEAVMLSAVHKGLPADAAGLDPYDIIVAIDGAAFAGHDALRKALREKNPGDALALTIIHRGQRKDVTVKVEAYDAQRMEEAEVEAIAAQESWFGAGGGPGRAPVAIAGSGVPSDLMDNLRDRIVGRRQGTPGAAGVGGAPGEDQIFIELEREQANAARAAGERASAHADRVRSQVDDQMRRMEDQMRRVEEMMRQMQQERDRKPGEADPQTRPSSDKS